MLTEKLIQSCCIEFVKEFTRPARVKKSGPYLLIGKAECIHLIFAEYSLCTRKTVPGNVVAINLSSILNIPLKVALFFEQIHSTTL